MHSFVPNGDVTSRLYEGLGHAINDDEMQTITTLVEQLVRVAGSKLVRPS